jgi:D-arabinose 1-dehydrogenase-like Zn-dependent alcohol dehydrogenase
MTSLPSISRAAVVRQFRAPVGVEEVPVPSELAPGAILTRITPCSMCGTDVHLWEGSLTTRVELPVILGHEMVGEIIALGAGADRDSVDKRIRIGDRITWSHTSCGSCFFSRAAAYVL